MNQDEASVKQENKNITPEPWQTVEKPGERDCQHFKKFINLQIQWVFVNNMTSLKWFCA